MSKLHYANGMNKFSAAKVAEFIFGAFFKEVQVDENSRMFNFIVYEEIGEGDEKQSFKDTFDKDWRDNFKEFWGNVPGFGLKVISLNSVELDD